MPIEATPQVEEMYRIAVNRHDGKSFFAVAPSAGQSFSANTLSAGSVTWSRVSIFTRILGFFVTDAAFLLFRFSSIAQALSLGLSIYNRLSVVFVRSIVNSVHALLRHEVRAAE